MNKNLLLLLVGVVLSFGSIIFRSSYAGNGWQIVLGIGILLEITGAIGLWQDAKRRQAGGGPNA